MNPPTGDDLDDSHVLIAAQHVVSTPAAARCQPGVPTTRPAHAAATRLRHRCRADGTAVWKAVRPWVSVTTGFLRSDDPTLATPYHQAIALVTRQWSGNQQRVVVGSTRISRLWTNGNAHLPGDVRIGATAHDGVTTNNHLQAMVQAAVARGCEPRLLAVDRWDASREHLTLGSRCPGRG